MSGSLVRLWAPVVAWAALIFAFSSVPDLGTGLGGWDLVLRKIAHAAEYAILGALLVRATGRAGLAFTLGALYAISDEVHQSFVPGRLGSPLDIAIDAIGVAAGVVLWQSVRARRHRMTDRRALAIELDAIGDTRLLWAAWLESAHAVLDVDPGMLPDDRSAAASMLDDSGAGNWRVLLERFAEDHAPAYLRRDAATSAALQSLAGSGATLGVFTDAPEPLARVALSQLGATRRISAVETGSGALERLLDTVGRGAEVVRTRADLLNRL